MSKKLVKDYYSDQSLTEWRRLVKDPYHRLEFDTTLHFIKEYLPKRGLALDAGGGPGRYTIELAKSGYDVVLLDITPKLLEFAQRRIKRAKVQKKVKQVIQGSIHDLSAFEDNTFDTVICLGGILSHIVNRRHREKAVDELIRVAKKNAPMFVSVIGRLAVLTTELPRMPKHVKLRAIFQKILKNGDYHGGHGFAPCHFYLPEELKESFAGKRVKVLEMVGLEGLASGHSREIKRLYRKYPKAWKIWWNIHLKTCTHPSVVGTSDHFMIICRKSIK